VEVPRPIQELKLLAESLNEMSSELKRLQEELRSRERLNTFARVAAGLAHDLQHPINAIRSACELAMASDDEAHTREFLKDAVDRQVPRLDKYVRDLRRISQDGKIPLELVTVDPVSLAKRIAADAAVNPKWTGVEFSAVGSASPVMVDESLVTRAITNLVGNAADATMGRTPARVTIEVGDPQADTLAIAVRDTGAGMTPERLQQIFSHDFRSDKRGSGIGLGLGVAKQVAAAHGGSLTAESRQGEGSVFKIVIPRPRPPEAGLQRAPAPRSGSTAHAS
jgi:signal transduction histidine kinase